MSGQNPCSSKRSSHDLEYIERSFKSLKLDESQSQYEVQCPKYVFTFKKRNYFNSYPKLDRPSIPLELACGSSIKIAPNDQQHTDEFKIDRYHVKIYGIFSSVKVAHRKTGTLYLDVSLNSVQGEAPDRRFGKHKNLRLQTPNSGTNRTLFLIEFTTSTRHDQASETSTKIFEFTPQHRIEILAQGQIAAENITIRPVCDFFVINGPKSPAWKSSHEEMTSAWLTLETWNHIVVILQSPKF